jgi:Xaa-Pro aminopeptidase
MDPGHGPPRIPRDEFRLRWKRLTDALAEREIDGWIAYADDHAVAGPDHVRYLCDLEPHFEPVVLVARGTAAPTLLTGPETVAYAELATAGTGVSEILSIRELEYPDEEYPTITSVVGAEAIHDLLGGCRSVGLLGYAQMPHALHQALLAPLAASTPVEHLDELPYALRAVRTEAEHAVIDEAYRIAAAGMSAAAATIEPGTTERAVAAAAEAAMRAAGAEGFGIDTMAASGPRNTAPILARSTFRRIEADDLVTVTLAPRYEGYHAALARPFLMRPNAHVERVAELAREAQSAAERLLVPGAAGREAEAASRAVIEGGRTGAEMPYAGVHSIGCVEFEPPIFHGSRATPIEEGMAISVDVPVFHGEWGGMRLEDGYRVGPDGPVPRLANQAVRYPLRLAG